MIPPRPIALWLYTYAARGIQDFVFAAENLANMIGASQLIEHQSTGRFDEALAVLCPNGYEPSLTQAAGSGRVLFRSEAAARKFAAHWPFVSQFDVPGLTIVQAVVPVGDSLAAAIQTAEQIMAEQRSRQWADLPVSGPLVAHERTTGLAIGRPQCRGTLTLESPSYATELRKNASAAANRSLREILPGVSPGRAVFDFKDLALENNAYLALVHVDGNGLGALVMRVMGELARLRDPAREAALYRQFSQAVARASRHALQEAARPIIAATLDDPKVPLRPLICAGDDLTVILRAGLAMDFVQAYAAAFEAETRKEFLHVEGLPGLGGLTCAAGVVIMKKSYPISQAYELCEDLCGEAKRRAGRDCSSVLFTRITTPLSGGSYEVILEEGLKVGDRAYLTLNPYGVGNEARHLPQLADLLSLVKVAENEQFSLGPVRKFLTTARRSLTEADQLMERFCTVQAGSKDASVNRLFADFRTHTCQLNGTKPEDARWWWRPRTDARSAGNPFDDMHDLIAARRIDPP